MKGRDGSCQHPAINFAKAVRGRLQTEIALKQLQVQTSKHD